MSIDPQSFAATITDIRRAAEYLAPVVEHTPLLESPYLNDIAGRRVLIKAEVLQRTGSFKFRGHGRLSVLWMRRSGRVVSSSFPRATMHR